MGRHLIRRLLSLGNEVWVVDDLSTGLHPECWLEGITERHEMGWGQRYSLGSETLTFIHEDLAVTLLRQLGRIPNGAGVVLPEFDYIYALASVVGGRVKIDGEYAVASERQVLS